MNLSHGDSIGKQTSEYKAWSEMKQRCYNMNNPRYADWGGRGIQVCSLWLHSYENFLRDMGRKPSVNHSLDRIDNNKSYAPDNCRWATKSQQIQNRRKRKDMRSFMVYKPATGIMVFNNQHHAARTLQLDARTVSKCLANQRHRHKGYHFTHLEK